MGTGSAVRAAAVSLACGCGTVIGAAAATVGPGDIIGDFHATTLEGRKFSFADEAARHKAVVFVFFSVSCPYSNRFAATVRDLDAALRDRGALFVAVNSNTRETAVEAAAYAEKFGHTFASVKDSNHVVADALGAQVNPSAFVVDGERRLRYLGVVKSKIGQPHLESALQEILAGKRVSTPEAKAFGCAIERD